MLLVQWQHSCLATYVKDEDNREKINSVLEDMVTKILFVKNAESLSRLTSLIIGHDQFYVFRDFVSKMVDCGARIRSTLKRCLYDPIMRDHNINDSHKRTIILSNVMPSLLLNNSTLRSSRDNKFGTTLTVGVYRNAMESVFMLMTAECHKKMGHDEKMHAKPKFS